MAQCTAPILGHIRGGGADCPVHGGRYGGYGGYGDPYYQRPAYTPPLPRADEPVAPPAPKRYPSFSRSSSGSSRISSGGGGRRTSSSSRTKRSAVTYSVREFQTLKPVREQVVRIADAATGQRDLFLCHAWDDRKGVALELHNLLTGLDVTGLFDFERGALI